MEQRNLFYADEAVTNPQTIAELLVAAEQLNGKTIAEIAKQANWSIPSNLNKNRGWIGQLIEHALGGSNNTGILDFDNLGVELKTVSFDNRNYPRSHTTIGMINQTIHTSWLNSNLYHKIQKILFITLQGDSSIALKDRLIGPAVFWQPTKLQLEIIHQDWLEIMELIELGLHHLISPRIGKILLVSSKGLNASCREKSLNLQGEIVLNQPLAFLLRREFIAEIIYTGLEQRSHKDH